MVYLTIHSGGRQTQVQSSQNIAVFVVKIYSTIILNAFLTNFKLGLVFRITIKTVMKDN